jgi:hypothetical protein
VQILYTKHTRARVERVNRLGNVNSGQLTETHRSKLDI